MKSTQQESLFGPRVEEYKAELYHRAYKQNTPEACQCCGQLVKLYRRKLNATIARDLIELYQRGGTHCFVYSGLVQSNHSGGGDLAKARFWGLIEQKEKSKNDPGGGRYSGLWKLTESGVAFVENRLKVQKNVLLFLGQPQGLEGEFISIEEAVQDHFNYDDLMAGGKLCQKLSKSTTVAGSLSVRAANSGTLLIRIKTGLGRAGLLTEMWNRPHSARHLL